MAGQSIIGGGASGIPQSFIIAQSSIGGTQSITHPAGLNTLFTSTSHTGMTQPSSITSAINHTWFTLFSGDVNSVTRVPASVLKPTSLIVAVPPLAGNVRSCGNPPDSVTISLSNTESPVMLSVSLCAMGIVITCCPSSATSNVSTRSIVSRHGQSTR